MKCFDCMRSIHSHERSAKLKFSNGREALIHVSCAKRHEVKGIVREILPEKTYVKNA